MFESLDKYFSSAITVKIDEAKIHKDVMQLRENLTNLSRILDKKLVFVVGKNKVEVFDEVD